MSSSILTRWEPENVAFWRDQGERIAYRNLWISIPALMLAFVIWMLWSVVAVNLDRAGFQFTKNQLFWLTALPALSGATLRIFYSFLVPIFGGRRFTAISTALLLIPALLKTRLGVDEVVTTLLGNFIVLLFVSMMLDGPMKDPMAMGWPQSVALNGDLELGKLIERTRAHTGLLWAAGLALGLWLLNRYTVFGFQMRAVGANAHASRFLGLPVSRVMLGTAMLSGALAGLAGAIEVAGRTGYVTLDMSPGYGYTGVVVAMLAGLHPLGVILASVFVAGMLVGADSMSRAIAVPNYIADVIVATSLLAMLVATLFAQYRLRRNRG